MEAVLLTAAAAAAKHGTYHFCAFSPKVIFCEQLSNLVFWIVFSGGVWYPEIKIKVIDKAIK